MKRAIGVLFALAALAAATTPIREAYGSGDMPPGTPKPDVEVPIRCNESACIVPRQVVQELFDAHNLHVDKIRALERRLQVLSEAKGCGKVEVVPPKPLPNFKKERDL